MNTQEYEAAFQDPSAMSNYVRFWVWTMNFDPHAMASPEAVGQLAAELLRVRDHPVAWNVCNMLLGASEEELGAGIPALSGAGNGGGGNGGGAPPAGSGGRPGAAPNAFVLRRNFARAVRLTAAQWLRDKVIDSLHELPDPDWRGQIRDSVLGHISRLSPELNDHRGQEIVATLGQCVGQLAIRLYVSRIPIQGQQGESVSTREWLNPIEDCCDSLSTDMQSALALMEVLTAIPDEFSRRSVRRSVSHASRDDYSEYLSHYGNYVLGVLTNFLAAAQSAQGNFDADPLMIQTSVFRCLEQWIFVGQFSPIDLVANPLVIGAFDGIGTEQLFDSCSEVIIGLFRQCRNVNAYPEQAIHVISKALQLQPMWQEVVAEGDDEKIESMAALYSELGENFASFIVETQAGLEASGGQLAETNGWATNFVHFMLQVSMYRGETLVDIPSATMQFWYRLYRALLAHSKQGSENSNFSPASSLQKSDRPLVFVGELLALVSVCCHLARIPYPEADDDAAEYDGEPSQEFSEFRGKLVETMRDLTHYLPASMVAQHLLSIFGAVQNDPDSAFGVPPQTENSSPEVRQARVLQATEAVIFALSSAYKYFDDDTVDQFTPSLIEQITPAAQQPRLAKGVFWLAANWGHFVNRHPEYAQVVFGIIYNGVVTTYQAFQSNPNVTDNDTLRSSCSALAELCSACPGPLCSIGYTQTLLELIQFISPGLESTHLIDLIQATGVVAQEFTRSENPDYNQVANVFQQLLTPPLTTVDGALANPGRTETATVVDALVLTKTVLQYCAPATPAQGEQHPFHDIVAQLLWPRLANLLVVFASSEKIVEKVCHTIKYLVRLLDHTAVYFQTAFVDSLLQGFAATGFDAYLYATNEWIGCIGNTKVESPTFPAAHYLLQQGLTGILEQVLPRLEMAGDFQEQPGLVQELMEGLGKILRRDPEVLLAHPRFSEVFELAYAGGLYMSHYEAGKSVCLFFEHLLAPKKAWPPELIAAVHNVVFTHGAMLVENLLGGVAGFLHRSLTKNARNILELVGDILGPGHIHLLRDWIAAFFQKVPIQVITGDVREVVMNQIFVQDPTNPARLSLADSRDILEGLYQIEDRMIQQQYLS